MYSFFSDVNQHMSNMKNEYKHQYADIVLSGWQAYYVVLTLMIVKKSCTTLRGVSINYTVVNASINAHCTV